MRDSAISTTGHMRGVPGGQKLLVRLTENLVAKLENAILASRMRVRTVISSS